MPKFLQFVLEHFLFSALQNLRGPFRDLSLGLILMIDIISAVMNIDKWLYIFLKSRSTGWLEEIKCLVLAYSDEILTDSAGRFPPTCLNSLPWLRGSHLFKVYTDRWTHGRNFRIHPARHWWIEVDKVECFASILLITPLSYIHSPESGCSLMLFCQWTSEPVTWRRKVR